ARSAQAESGRQHLVERVLVLLWIQWHVTVSIRQVLIESIRPALDAREPLERFEGHEDAVDIGALDRLAPGREVRHAREEMRLRADASTGILVDPRLPDARRNLQLGPVLGAPERAVL